MKNEVFQIGIARENGCIDSIVNRCDSAAMNWCSEFGKWGRIIVRKTADAGGIHPSRYSEAELGLESLNVTDTDMTAVYSDDRLRVAVERVFTENGRLRERYCIKNINQNVVTINRDTFKIEVPLNDRYTCADECMDGHCHAHIWCGKHVTWISALKMGASEYNLGLVLTKGSIVSYSQRDCYTNERGIYLLEPETVLLKPGQEYTLEWELFWHKGKEDFKQKLTEYKNYIEISTKHNTVFENEKIEFEIKTVSGEIPQVFLLGEEIETEYRDGAYAVCYSPLHTGEYQFLIKAGTSTTYTEFLVRSSFAVVLEKRVNFIVDHQQCLDEESPLYGAYLIYDNETEAAYYDETCTDHNACRERLNMPIVIARYLQEHPDEKIRKSFDLYMNFLRRECYEETTGEVFNSVGKNQTALRLYNAPGVMLLFAEGYLLTKEEWFLDNILTLADRYYGIGGEKCYANGIAIARVIKAFREAKRVEDEQKLLQYFQRHVNNMIKNGLSYPKHEVNYEQTIVTPTVTCISEMGVLSEDQEFYKKEAKKHLECLDLFSGFQPSFHLNEIAIRFWDDFWFGKRGCFGDTFPHHLSSLTGRAYIAYYRLTGEEQWLAAAENCLRNCMCLVSEDGRGFAAYVYPHTVNGEQGGFYDEWANDQDVFFYHALNGADLIPAFVI